MGRGGGEEGKEGREREQGMKTTGCLSTLLESVSCFVLTCHLGQAKYQQTSYVG